MKSIFLLLVVIGLFIVPIVASASATQVIVITASPLLGNECVTNFGMSVDLPDELILTWTTASLSNGTKIVLDYGEWPTGCNDGTLVYEGNGSSATFIVDPDGFDDGVFVKAFAMVGNECSNCYASGSAISTGEAGSGVGNITIDTGGIDDMADYIKTTLILAIPFLLGILGAVRHSITGYVAGIIGFGISLPYVNDHVGIYLVAPMVAVIVGLGLGLVRDAWEQDLEVF